MTKEEQKALEMLGFTVEKAVDLLGDLLRAGMSNPILGITGAVAITDIMARLQLISNEARTIIFVSIGAIEGAATAGSIIKDLIPFKNSANELMPTGSTFVFGGNGTSEIAGLVESKGKVKK